jgi:PAS domain S-box-containing protein
MSPGLPKDSAAAREALLNGLHLLTSAGIFSTDVDLNLTSWNQWLEEHSGKVARDVLGRNLLELFPELAERRLNKFYQQALHGQVVVLSQQLHNYLLRLPPSLQGDLPQMPQSARIAPLLDAGAIVGTVTWIEDVTERVVREAELFARARQQSAIAALSHDALASRNLDELFQQSVSIIAETLRMEFCAVFELAAGALQLRAGLGWKGPATEAFEPGAAGSFVDFVLQNPAPTVIHDLTTEDRFAPPQVLRDQGIVSGLCAPIRCGGKTYGLLGVYSGQPSDRPDEELDFLQAAANVLGTAIERDGLERSLRDRAHELVNADRRKNEFLAMLAHELRNPLAPIRNAIQMLYVKNVDDVDMRAARDLMDRQVRQITRMVDDLLDVSRITRGKIALREETVDLAEVVAHALETSRPLIDLHRHELTVSLPQGPMPIRGDATRLAQAIANLVNNSTKYTDPGGKISVAVQRSGADYLVKVKDNGIGISSEMLPQIFDLFKQVDNSLARSEGGLGIGLTLVRTLIEMHGGNVKAFSDGPGRGSEFVVRLPALDAEFKSKPIRASAPSTETRPAARKILVVDDNTDAAESLAQLLRALGHASRSVHSGPAALEEVRRDRPDAVFLDIGLPGMDGYAVARALREEHAGNIAVIALSGYGENDESKNAGFDRHVIKPIDLSLLRRILSELPSPA